MRTALTRACEKVDIKKFIPHEISRTIKINLPFYEDVLFFQPSTPKRKIISILKKIIKINKKREKLNGQQNQLKLNLK